MGDYFDLNRWVSVILLLIPFTCWIFGVATRLKDKHYVAAILRLFFGCWILWVIEVVLTIMNNCTVMLWKPITI